ncbi:DUF1801 domain-containing protein [Vagococcus sp. DIV0080]|uniref:DUF1801 domain-containing protein n=1 Tax=Candidatus Vagococcus giribetii TaxID=2230876 RepID=A0ABS3HUW7_9ENTE|nr:DUF1801 domain-containing protein [Vagococcus sp. DIV0080]MBO0477549.1 DUF1801 domain-containing protein [Vagococcus sp. DIV0080]
MSEIEEYIQGIDENRQVAFNKLVEVVRENIPEGFEEVFQYGMITYAVPLDVFPEGYLNRVDEPLPFISLGAQKRHLALYHLGIMGNKELLQWFQEEYAKVVPTKLNMGKSCIRMTNVKHIPYELIGELVSKMSMEEWIESYQKFQNKKG